MVPPLSTTLRCSSIRSITGCGVCGSNSLELAPASPHASRANSITAHCKPRHSPRNGTSMLPGEPGGGDLALDAAEPEPAGDHDAVEVAQAPFGEEPFGVVGGDPVDLHFGLARVPAVLERFDHRQVRVGQVDVLADQADAHRFGGGFDLGDELAPVAEVGLVLVEVQDTCRRSRRGPRRAARAGSRRATARRRTTRCRLGHVAQLGDLLLEPGRDRPVGAAHDRVGLDAPAAQLGDGVLRGLGLLLAGRADERHQRHVHVEHVVAPDVFAELPDRLEERAGSRCRRRCRRSR